MTGCLTPSIGHDDRVAGTQEHRRSSLALDRILVIEADGLKTRRALPQDADVLGIGEVAQAAGHRECLEDGHVALQRDRPGWFTSPTTYAVAAVASTTMTVTTGLLTYSFSAVASLS